MQNRPMKIDEKDVKQIMSKADIPGLSIAFVNNKGETSTKELGVTEKKSKASVSRETIFGAASLSKPVFAYLVLKLVGKIKLPDGTPFDLKTPLYKILPELSLAGKNAEALTAEIILSHRTGVPISQGNGLPQFDFEPGTRFGYSGFPYIYLQMAIEKLTNSTLEELAKEYVFKPLGMNHSTFLRPGTFAHDDSRVTVFPIDTSSFRAISANSLRTTSSDYALFIKGLLNDEKLHADPFKSQISMSKDQWAIDARVPTEDRRSVAWGLGWGLQTNNSGKVTRAFHAGDMDECRGFVAINLEDKSAIVYFANSANGHVLADQIITPHVKLEHGLNYFFKKFGFARTVEEFGPEGHGLGLKVSPAIIRKNDKAQIAELASEKNHSSDVSQKKSSTALLIEKGVGSAEMHLPNAQVLYPAIGDKTEPKKKSNLENIQSEHLEPKKNRPK